MKFYKDKFKQIRKLKRISTQQLAEESGISRVSISNWERGIRIPREHYVKILAESLEISPSEISDIHTNSEFSNIDLDRNSKTFHSFLDRETEQESKINAIVSEIKNLSSDLEQTRITLNALMMSMDSLFYIKDKNLKYIVANDAFIKNFSLVNQYIVKGKQDIDLLPKKEAVINEKEDFEILHTGKPIHNIECFLPGSRRKKIALKSKHPLKDKDGLVMGIMGIYTDITAYKKNERERIILEKCINKIKSDILITKKINQNKFDILFVNDSALENALHMKKSDFKNLNELWDMLPEHKKRYFDLINTANNFPVYKEYLTHYPTTGEEYWFSETVYNPFQDYYFSILQDLTQKKQMETQRLILEKLINRIDSFVAIIKKNKFIEGNLEVLFLSEQAVESTTGEKHKIKDLTKFWHTELPKHYKNFKRIINDNISYPYTHEFKALHPTTYKERIITEQIYNPIKDYYLIIANDITEQINNSRKINLLEKVINNTFECVTIRQTDPKKIVFLSKSFETFFGPKREEYLKNGCSAILDIIHEDYRQKELEYSRSYSYPKHRYYKILRHDATFTLISETTNKTVYDNNEYLICVARDISMIRQLHGESEREDGEIISYFKHENSLDIAKKLIKEKISDEIIARSTQLKLEEVKRLKAENKN